MSGQKTITSRAVEKGEEVIRKNPLNIRELLCAVRSRMEDMDHCLTQFEKLCERHYASGRRILESDGKNSQSAAQWKDVSDKFGKNISLIDEQITGTVNTAAAYEKKIRSLIAATSYDNQGTANVDETTAAKDDLRPETNGALTVSDNEKENVNRAESEILTEKDTPLHEAKSDTPDVVESQVNETDTPQDSEDSDESSDMPPQQLADQDEITTGQGEDVSEVMADMDEESSIGSASVEAQDKAPMPEPELSGDATTIALDEQDAAQVLNHIIEKTRNRDIEEYEQDKAEMAKIREEMVYWSRQTSLLGDTLPGLSKDFESLVASSAENREAMETDWQEKLKSRQQGLELINKMMTRVLDKLPQAVVDESNDVLPEPLGEEQWRELTASAQENAEQQLKQRLKSLGAERYTVISTMRKVAEQGRSALLKLVEKDLLPVLDGIDDGERGSDSLVHQGGAETSERDDALEAWFGTYGVMRDHFLKTLAGINVRRMDIEPGMPVDYARHEPFDVEPADGLEDETIKSVVRHGYEHIRESLPVFDLRSAQVVVVKNEEVDDA
jgi:molecular chaperone GrpE (heat shock protein)